MFSKKSKGPSSMPKPQIFLSYATCDQSRVEELYLLLRKRRYNPWMDKKRLLGGQEWEETIKRQIRKSDLFLACLSKNSINKRGVLQKEIKQAIEIWHESLVNDIYLIPVRLENCDIPEELRKFQWINLFEPEGSSHLFRSIRESFNQKNAEKSLNTSMPGKRKALDKALFELFSFQEKPVPRHLHKAIKNIERFTVAMSRLQIMSDWANDRYVRFLSGLLNSVVNESAVALKNLIGGADWELTFPKIAADMADSLLTEQMDAMKKDDYYDVISDLISWQGNQLSKFHKKTEIKVKGGVRVRRVFNLLRNRSDVLSPEETEQTLERHLQDARTWTSRNNEFCYEVKILGEQELKAAHLKTYFDERIIREAHFGIFRHGKHKEKAVRFKVIANNLSQMKLCRRYRAIEKDLHLFEKVWEAATPIDEAGIIKVVDECVQKWDQHISAEHEKYVIWKEQWEIKKAKKQ